MENKSRIFLATIIVLVLLSGCGFIREDNIVTTKYIYPDTGVTKVVEDYTSWTAWTLFKEIELGEYKSENNKIKAFGGAGYIESE